MFQMNTSGKSSQNSALKMLDLDEILDELNIIREFIPKEPSAEVIEKTDNEWITKNDNPDKRQIGVLINYVKECLLFTADGKTVTNIVKKFID